MILDGTHQCGAVPLGQVIELPGMSKRDTPATGRDLSLVEQEDLVLREYS